MTTKPPNLTLVTSDDAVVEDDNAPRKPLVLTKENLTALADKLLDGDVDEADIQGYFEDFIAARVGVILMNRWKDEIKKRVGLTSGQINAIEKDAKAVHEQRLAEAEARKAKAAGKVGPMDPDSADIEDMRVRTIDDEDPMLISGWGYTKIVQGGDVTYSYTSPGLIGKRFSREAQRPHNVPLVNDKGEIETVALHLEERKDPKNGSAYWVRVAPPESVPAEAE